MERFRLRTETDWRQYVVFLCVATAITVGTWALVAPTLENLTALLGGLLVFAAIFTPVLYVATLRRGNYVEVRDDCIRVHRWWWPVTTHVRYDEIESVNEGVKHHWFVSLVLPKSGIPLEPHIDVIVRFTGLMSVWRLCRALSLRSAVHLAVDDSHGFAEAVNRRLAVAPPEADSA